MQPPLMLIFYLWVGPGADFSRRLDTKWKESGICRFDKLAVSIN